MQTLKYDFKVIHFHIHLDLWKEDEQLGLGWGYFPCPGFERGPVRFIYIYINQLLFPRQARPAGYTTGVYSREEPGGQGEVPCEPRLQRNKLEINVTEGNVNIN